MKKKPRKLKIYMKPDELIKWRGGYRQAIAADALDIPPRTYQGLELGESRIKGTIAKFVRMHSLASLV